MAAHFQFGTGVGEHMTHVATAIEAFNIALDGLPPEQLRLHVCWGNYIGAHNHDVPLRTIIEPTLKANVQTSHSRAANPTHQHEWEVFNEVELPEDKVLMPGVVDVHAPRLEHPRVVAQRLLQFVQLVGRKRVIAGTDCGFSANVGRYNVPPSIAWAKLRVLAEGAEIASWQPW